MKRTTLKIWFVKSKLMYKLYKKEVTKLLKVGKVYGNAILRY